MIGELATGLVSSALYEAARAPIKWLSSANRRHRELVRTIEGKASEADEAQSRRVNGAFQDLVRILGNEYGKYTDRVDSFIKELKSSAIPGLIYKAVITGKNADQIFPSFNIVYSSFAPLPFDSKELFRALHVAVKTRIDQSLQDPFAAELIRAQVEEIRDQVTSLLSAISQASGIASLPAQKFAECRNRIAKSIELSNRDIPVETDRGTRRILISRLVIPARLRIADVGPSGISVKEHPTRDTMSLLEFRRNLERAVVVGDPGGGKSTLTQLLCYDMARRLTLDAKPRSSDIDERDLRLPLRVIVRTYDRKQRSSPGYSILDYLRDELKPSLDNDGLLTESFLKQALETGKAVLLFDGLDEVLEVGRRREMAALIEQFINANAACPSLVTSRVVGYVDAPLSREFSILALSRLSREEVGMFAEKLIKAISGKAANAKEQSLDFLKQTETHASDLRENPLLLGLMVYIFHERGDVPDNRPKIYSECSQLLFLKWDQRRDIKFEYPEDFELMDLFGYLAVRVFGDPDAEDGVSHDWLFGQIRDFFAEWYTDRAKASAAAKALVEFITGRAWVMCDVGPSTYKFTHRTFMEYFVARRLEAESVSVQALLEKLYSRVVRGEWDVVSHLAIQIAASSGPKAAMAVDGLKGLLEGRSRNQRDEQHFLLFVARSLEYLPVPERTFSGITTVLLERAMRLGAKDYSAISIFSVLLKSAKRKADVLTSLMVKHVDQALRDKDKQNRRFAQYVMCAQGETFFDKQYIRLYPSVPHAQQLWDAMEAPRRTNETVVFQEACKDPSVARIYIVAYQQRVEDLWKVHGARLLFDAYGPLAPTQFNLLRYALLEVAVFGGMRYGAHFKRLDILVQLIADEAEKNGITLEGSSRRKRDPKARDAVAHLEEIFRALWHFSRRGSKTSPTMLKGYRQTIIFAFLCFEFDSKTHPLAFERPGARAKLGRPPSRRRLLVRSMPPEVIDELIVASDLAAKSELLQKWVSGEVDLLKVASA